eukprot:7717075-Lingulodinium_polyedra.AAC.1
MGRQARQCFHLTRNAHARMPSSTHARLLPANKRKEDTHRSTCSRALQSPRAKGLLPPPRRQ